MLTGLDCIPWSKISTFSGDASQVAVAIRNLAGSQTEEIAAETCKFLENELEHQDGVTQATAFATPFLVELLGNPSALVTPKVAGLLWSFHRSAKYVLECEMDTNPYLVQHPEKYRGDAATFTNDRSWPLSESIAWNLLIVKDLENLTQLPELVNHREEPIRNAASFLDLYLGNSLSSYQVLPYNKDLATVAKVGASTGMIFDLGFRSTHCFSARKGLCETLCAEYATSNGCVVLATNFGDMTISDVSYLAVENPAQDHQETDNEDERSKLIERLADLDIKKDFDEIAKISHLFLRRPKEKTGWVQYTPLPAFRFFEHKRGF